MNIPFKMRYNRCLYLILMWICSFLLLLHIIHIMANLLFLTQNTQIWKNRPRPPNFGKKNRFLSSNIFVSSVCFQRALNDSSSMFLVQIMANLLFLAQNAHIWKNRPRPPNFEKQLDFCLPIYLSHLYASNEPSMTPRACF